MSRTEFAYEVNNQARPLKNFALKLTRNVEDANDLVQETMLKALTNQEKYSDGTNLKGWLYTIMKNLFINNYRRISKGNIIHDDTEDQYYLNNSGLAESNQAETKLALQDIYTAIDRLNENLRIPFMMSYVGYKYEEIANSLRIPLGTVKIRIFNARQILKRNLSSYGHSYGFSAN